MNKSLTIFTLGLLGCCLAAACSAAAAVADAAPLVSPAAQPPEANKPAPVSPYALAARRHALAAAPAPLLVMPPSQRHTRLVSGQVQQH